MAALPPKVKDHFLNPRNVGVLDKADAIGVAGDPDSGAGIRLFFKLNGNGSLERVTYQIVNRAHAIAPASVFSELAVGRKLEEVSAISRQELLKTLECEESDAGNMRFDVLEAFANALTVLGKQPHGDGAAESTPSTSDGKPAGDESPDKSKDYDKPKLMIMQAIQDVLDTEIRPAIAMDGGDCELVDVDGKRVLLRLHGHCVGCASAGSTIQFFIEDRLRELVDPGLEVVDVTDFDGIHHAAPGMMGY